MIRVAPDSNEKTIVHAKNVSDGQNYNANFNFKKYYNYICVHECTCKPTKYFIF